MKATTKSEKAHMDRVAQIGCIIKKCGSPATIHHCGTYMGGGRDHMRVIPLCWQHHLGPEGIDGKKMGKRVWEMKYGTEEALLKRVNEILNQYQQVTANGGRPQGNPDGLQSS